MDQLYPTINKNFTNLIKIIIMENNGTRLEITQELNQLLNERLKELRSQGVKGMNKKILLEQLCIAGLEYQNNGGHSNSLNGQQKNIGFETKNELEVLKSSLKEKEAELRSLEKYLNNKERKILLNYEGLATEREKLSGQLNDLLIKNSNIHYKEERLEEKKEEVNELKTENEKLRKDIMKILKNIDSKTNKDLFFDKILPITTPALIGYLIFSQSGIKIWDNQYTPIIKNLTNALKMLSKEEQLKMIEEIVAVINKYAGKKEQKHAAKTGDVS